jgi:hypothetical protein
MEHIIQLEREWMQAISEEREKLKRDVEKFEKEKAEWNALQKKLNDTQLDTRIKLDVGGQIFATSLQTLTSKKGTYFEAMFSGRWDLKKQDDGTYFIDRDPFVFRHILNFLRGDPIPLEHSIAISMSEFSSKFLCALVF